MGTKPYGERHFRFETLQLHAGQETPDPATGARAVPIYQTSSFVFEDCARAADRFALREEGNIYSRLTNPTVEAFEKRMAALEGGVAAVAVASGAAAVTCAVQNVALSGGHIVAAKNLYGGTYNLLAHTLPDYGITTTFVDPLEPEQFAKAIQENTKALYIEALGNPNCEVTDIEAVAKIAHAHGIPLMIDATFATPYLLRPIEYGADIVIHSATKFIGGHGTSLGGVIVDAGRFDWKASGKFPQFAMPDASYHGLSFVDAAGAAAFSARLRAILLRDTGACLSPFHAFFFHVASGNERKGVGHAEAFQYAYGEHFRLGGGENQFSSFRLPGMQKRVDTGIGHVFIHALPRIVFLKVFDGLVGRGKVEAVIAHEGIIERRPYEGIEFAGIVFMDTEIFQRVHDTARDAFRRVGQCAVKVQKKVFGLSRRGKRGADLWLKSGPSRHPIHSNPR